jgi:inosose dehydratase
MGLAMKDVLVACAQLTWKNVPEDQVLGEIARAGYVGAPAGPYRRTAEETKARYAEFGLMPAPGYLSGEFWKADQLETLVERADNYARFARDVGCSEVYIAASGFDSYVGRRGKTRKQVAGHVQAEDMMTDEEWKQFIVTLNAVGRATLNHGVKSCFHNHVGSTIETAEEFDRMLSEADPELIFLGPDTGHLAWGGVDVVPFLAKYASRIKTIHLKDVSGTVVDRGVREQWDYDTFVKHGLFVELGEGVVDLPGLLQLLDGAGFKGWIIVETDVTQKPTALESASVSRNYLKSLGL